ncbi:MAG: alpha-L-rhamnosidase [Oscillospiraceae bacterium]|nr:alpha-L-rhamnosidase [Oscillospiraceae bacterium]
MDKKCFSGRWICAREFSDKRPLNLLHPEREAASGGEHDESLKNFHMIVRKYLFIEEIEKYDQIKIKLTADDYYKLYINGNFVGQGPAPGYYFAYYFNEFDIKPFLSSGQNEISLNVYYQGLVNRVWNSGDLRQGMVADVIADGELICATDSNWEYAVDHSYTGKRTIGYLTQYLEDIDSRIKPLVWQNAYEKETDHIFSEVPAKPVSVYEVFPMFKKKIINGGWFYDFGTEITAGLCINAIGKSGETLRILCGEECDAEGRVRYKMRCNCDCEEFWTLDDGNNHLDQYDYKAFRYAEIIPQDGDDIVITSVSAMVRHYPFDQKACTLISSDKVLESVFTICKNAVRYGSQEVFVDCPSREKGQYAGDMTITGASHLLLTGDASLLRKAIDNQVQSLQIAGGMLAVTPGSFMQEIADYSLQFPLHVWRYYLYTGDKSFLKEMVAPCDELLSHFGQFRRSDGLLEKVDDKWNLVDWPGNLRDGYDFPLTKPIGEGCHNVINAFYVGCVKLVEQIKREVGLPVHNEADQLIKAFNKAFFRADLGLYVDSDVSSHSSLHANCIPAFFELMPFGSEKGIADFLTQKGMCCGVYMSYFLLKGLAKLGRHDIVYNLITSTGKNSWYNMVHEGGTTCFEAWGKEQKPNTSLCHPWASAPIPVIIEDLVGLTVLSGTGTYQVEPKLPENLEQLELFIPLPQKRLHFTYSSGDYSIREL